jgi:hypothetical protein
VDSVQLAADCGQLTVGSGQWTVGSEQYPVGSAYLAMGSNSVHWAVDRQWAVNRDSVLWTVGRNSSQ